MGKGRSRSRKNHNGIPRRLPWSGASNRRRNYRKRIYKHIVECWGMHCFLCNRPIKEGSEYNIDHIIPWGKGGSHDIENVWFAHEICNRERGDQSLIKSMAKLEKFYSHKGRQQQRKSKNK